MLWNVDSKKVLCYNFSLFLCYLMHDAIIFSLRWHQIIAEEELPALFQEKRRVSQQGRISDSKIGKKTCVQVATVV